MYNHNKAQQSKNRVHISWEILYQQPWYWFSYNEILRPRHQKSLNPKTWQAKLRCPHNHTVCALTGRWLGVGVHYGGVGWGNIYLMFYIINLIRIADPDANNKMCFRNFQLLFIMTLGLLEIHHQIKIFVLNWRSKTSQLFPICPYIITSEPSWKLHEYPKIRS